MSRRKRHTKGWKQPFSQSMALCEYISRGNCDAEKVTWRTGKPSTVIEEWYCQWHSNAEGASDIEPDGFCAWGERKEDESE